MDERTTETPETGAGLPPEPDRPYTAPSDGKGVWMKGAPREEFAARSALSREPLTRTERLLVTMFVTMFAAMLGVGALGFTAISGQLLDMQKQIGELRTDTQTEIGNLRTDLHKQIGGVRTEIGEFRTDLHKQIGEFRTEIGELRTDLHKQIGEFRTEMHDEIGELSERMARVETLIETHLVPQTSVPTPAGS